jgi:MFS family permease
VIIDNQHAGAAIPSEAERGGDTRYNARRLFLISVLALFTAALSFSLRAALATEISNEVFGGSAELIGTALGVAFLSFAITTIVVSPLLDWIGIKTTMVIAGLCFIAAALTMALGHWASPQWGYTAIWTGMMLNGIGWGCTEGAINPMTAAIYPEDKTHRMNVLHAWWPAGLIVGGLLGYGIGAVNAPWYIAILVIIVPSVIFLGMIAGQTFPNTESHSLGVKPFEMLTEVLRHPSFFIWFGLMFLTASTELAPGQWVDIALTEVVGMRGILLLVFVSGIMFVMRHFAGPIAHRISSVGLLFGSSIFATIGLLLMAHANSPFTALFAAAVWGVGVCFMWPTMLAIAAERYPRGGAWTIGLIASAGAMAIYFVLPKLGAIYDSAVAEGATKVVAATSSFEVLAWLPAILTIAFGAILMIERFSAIRIADRSIRSQSA